MRNHRGQWRSARENRMVLWPTTWALYLGMARQGRRILQDPYVQDYNEHRVVG